MRPYTLIASMLLSYGIILIKAWERSHERPGDHAGGVMTALRACPCAAPPLLQAAAGLLAAALLKPGLRKP
jgi:hypothetical protein